VDRHSSSAPEGCCVSAHGNQRRKGQFYVLNNPTGKSPAGGGPGRVNIPCGSFVFSMNRGTKIDPQPGPFPALGHLPSGYVPSYLKGLTVAEARLWHMTLGWSCCGEKTIGAGLYVETDENASGDIKATECSY
jgi:hypothetical protein